MRIRVFAWSVLLIAGCAISPMKASPNEEERKVEPFHSVVIAGSENLHVSQGTEQKLLVVADDDVLRHLKTTVRNGTLYVEMEDHYGYHFDSDVHVFVTMKEVRALHVAGSGNIKGETTVQSDELKLKISGSGNITMDVKATSIRTAIAGSGDVRLTGSTENHDVGISGSGSVSALDLSADRYDISISGSGTSKVSVKSSLDISISGSGKVSYSGNPDKLNTQVSGSGRVTKL